MSILNIKFHVDIILINTFKTLLNYVQLLLNQNALFFFFPESHWKMGN